MPVLDEAGFLESPDARREKLIGDGIVSMEKQLSKSQEVSGANWQAWQHAPRLAAARDFKGAVVFSLGVGFHLANC